MINPEVQYSLWRSAQRRRDIELERRRAYLQAHRPDPLDPAVLGFEACEASTAHEESAGFDLGVAS